jgi:hypothetical protein
MDSTKSSSKSINYTKLAFVGVGTAGTMAVIHVYQKNAWWSGQRRSFHVVNDWEYALNIDKIGHFYGANLISNLFSSFHKLVELFPILKLKFVLQSDS